MTIWDDAKYWHGIYTKGSGIQKTLFPKMNTKIGFVHKGIVDGVEYRLGVDHIQTGHLHPRGFRLAMNFSLYNMEKEDQPVHVMQFMTTYTIVSVRHMIQYTRLEEHIIQYTMLEGAKFFNGIDEETAEHIIMMLELIGDSE